MTALYAGSFDPVTLGHLDVIRRAICITEHLVVAVLHKPAKEALFSTEERVALLQAATKDYPTVQVDAFTGLLAVYARQVGAAFLVRGVRSASDLDYEMNMARHNRVLTGGLDTFFIPADAAFAHVSGSAVREIAGYVYRDGLDDAALETMVSPVVRTALKTKFTAWV